VADFIYLFRGAGPAGSPAEMQAHMQKWAAWVKDLSGRGLFKAGEPLEEGGRVVKGKKRAVTDGPFAEHKDLVGGYLLVTAKDLDEATEVAKECPIFDLDGQVEVRAVRAMQR
jgi:hypothetical protein